MSDSNKPRVLVVEDTNVIRNSLARRMQAEGCPRVGTARNGEEALIQAETLQPQLILLDIVMPVMNGTEALPLLRKLLPDAVIIIMTSLSESHIVQQCKEAGADGFVLKTDGGLADAVVSLADRLWQRKLEKITRRTTEGAARPAPADPPPGSGPAGS